MNKQHAKGAIDSLVGKTKEAAGRTTGNAKLEIEGKVQQVKGAMHNAAGDVTDAAKNLIDRGKAGVERH